jgi:uncharacterized protein
MDPAEIIRKYYASAPAARDILLSHGEAVAEKALEIGRSLSHLELDLRFLEEAAFLHDIGILHTDATMLCCHGWKPYICHGHLGREILEAEGLPRHALAAERHVGMGLSEADIRRNGYPLPVREMVPVSLEEKIVCFADKFFSKEGGLDREKPLGEVRDSIGLYGAHKLRVFDEWCETFGGHGPFLTKTSSP